MSDIFISYKREDQAMARKLANALESEGWTVFLELKLHAGEHFNDVMEKALNEAKCVVVLWSKGSVQSEYVRAEAAHALEKDKLVPVAIDNVDLPFRFRDIHTRSLLGWDGSQDALDFRNLVEDVAAMVVGRIQGKAAQETAGSTLSPLVSEEVHLGVAAPGAVCPGEEFVARVAAYTEAHRSEVVQVIAQEAPSAQPRLDLETCRWHPGTKVTVRLDAHYVEVSNPIQTFKWNGAWCVLRFDAKVPVDIEVNTIILRFDIAVEGLPIVAIRPEIAVSRKEKEKETISSVSVIAPSRAFASYAKKDRRDVLGRVRSLQIFTGIDVFLDCLSIRPGEEWKSKLKKEIHERDVFWLFWSRSAMASEWVEWEWRTALAEKSLAKIQPHPLEPLELAPPPKELSSLQFGAMYEWYVSQLRESPITRLFRTLLHKAVSLVRRR